jgi:hypothetical protein
MLQVAKMLKVAQSVFSETMEVQIRDGMYFILTKQRKDQLRDLMLISDYTSTDHSILSQDFHSTELLNATVLTTSGSEDGERMSLHNNSTSTKHQRLSDLNNGRTTPWKSNPTVDQPIFVSHQVSHQDGGKCSNGKHHTL